MRSRGTILALAVLLLLVAVVAGVAVLAALRDDDVTADGAGYAAFACSVNDRLADGGLDELVDGAGGPEGSLIAAEAGLLAAAGRIDPDLADLTAPGEQLMAALQRAQGEAVTSTVDDLAEACADVERVEVDRDRRDALACAVADRLAEVAATTDGLRADDGAPLWELRAMAGLATGGEHEEAATALSRSALALDADGYADGLAALTAACD